MSTAFLILESPNGERNNFTLRKELTSLGRDEDNHITINNEYVSAFHAEFRSVADGNTELVDLDSHNGTEVNGTPIETPVTLQNGDVLCFGIIKGTFYQPIEATSLDETETANSSEAFLPNLDRGSSHLVKASTPPAARPFIEDLSGVVLSFEEFDFAPPIENSGRMALLSDSVAPSESATASPEGMTTPLSP